MSYGLESENRVNEYLWRAVATEFARKNSTNEFKLFIVGPQIAYHHVIIAQVRFCAFFSMFLD